VSVAVALVRVSASQCSSTIAGSNDSVCNESAEELKPQVAIELLVRTTCMMGMQYCTCVIALQR
jgi:hypothetical protein